MRFILILLMVVLAAGCGSVEYRDSNAAVDANPLCAGRPDRPGEMVSPDCERKSETIWSSDKSSDEESLDFSGKKD